MPNLIGSLRLDGTLTGQLSDTEAKLTGYLSNATLRGMPIELRVQDGTNMLQWRYIDEDDNAWRDLIVVNDYELLNNLPTINGRIIIGEIGDLVVTPENGKELSTNDFTDEYKDKLDGIENSADVNTIESISIDGVTQAIDANKNVELEIEWDAVNNRPKIEAGTGQNSVIIGDIESNTATSSDDFAEGMYTTASGGHSHAAGYWTNASGPQSFSMGFQSSATNSNSVAEGYQTVASGASAHAFGSATTASGNHSISGGTATIANHKSQFVFGEYNIEDPSSAKASQRGTYIEIVGNGTVSNARSNARTLDWNGNEILAGKLTVGTAPVNDMDAATKKYVDDAVDGVDVPVEDVQINGTSIVDNGVANIPIAGTEFGAVKVRGLGVVVDNGTYGDVGELRINPASNSQIKRGVGTTAPITATTQHQATFYGLTKAAGVNMANSDNPVGTYTAAAKTAIQSMLGIDTAIADAVSGITGFDFTIVQELPQSGEKGIIYLVAHSHDTDDGFDEYIWIDNGFEKLGHCDVDLTDYVRNTDYATLSKSGVIKVGDGLYMRNGSFLTINAAPLNVIKLGNYETAPIVTAHQHEATFYGLAKAAGHDEKDSNLEFGTYTDDAKTAIKNMLGVVDGAIDIGTVETLPAGSSATASITGNYDNMSLNLGIPKGDDGITPVIAASKTNGITTITVNSTTVATIEDGTDYILTNADKADIAENVEISSFVEVVSGTDPVIVGEPNYRYMCGEVYTISITPPSSGTIDVVFTSGSTPAVLTIPNTVKMPEWWEGVEADYTYEICIIDGVYAGVISWPI